MFTIIEETDNLSAVTYNKKDIRIKICYPKDDAERKECAINDFWKELERQSINLQIVNGTFKN
jgi:hypothetical protein